MDAERNLHRNDRIQFPRPPISSCILPAAAAIRLGSLLLSTFPAPSTRDALKASFEEWTSRHDALSCSFSQAEESGESSALFVDVADVGDLRLREETVADARTPEQVRDLLGERLDRWCNPFAFPAYFLGAITREDQSTVVCGFDHAICDGWSMSIAITEISTLYREYTRADRDPIASDLLPEPGSFLNYCFRESATADPEPGDHRIAGWRSFLRACGGDTPHFPVDLGLPAGAMSPQGTDTRMLLDADEAELFDQNCADHRHSSFGAILASIGLATTQLTGKRDSAPTVPCSHASGTATSTTPSDGW